MIFDHVENEIFRQVYLCGKYIFLPDLKYSKSEYMLACVRTFGNAINPFSPPQPKGISVAIVAEQSKHFVMILEQLSNCCKTLSNCFFVTNKPLSTLSGILKKPIPNPTDPSSLLLPMRILQNQTCDLYHPQCEAFSKIDLLMKQFSCDPQLLLGTENAKSGQEQSILGTIISDVKEHPLVTDAYLDLYKENKVCMTDWDRTNTWTTILCKLVKFTPSVPNHRTHTNPSAWAISNERNYQDAFKKMLSYCGTPEFLPSQEARTHLENQAVYARLLSLIDTLKEPIILELQICYIHGISKLIAEYTCGISIEDYSENESKSSIVPRL